VKIVVGDLVIPSLQHINNEIHYVGMTDIFLVIAVSSIDPDILEVITTDGARRKISALYFKKCNVPT
jgi:hypothetical protein